LGAFGPVYIPGFIEGDEDLAAGADPGLVDHFGGEVVKATDVEGLSFAFAFEDHGAAGHCEDFIASVPMIFDVEWGGGADEESRRAGLGIGSQDGELRGMGAEIEENFVPLEVFVLDEHRLGGLSVSVGGEWCVLRSCG